MDDVTTRLEELLRKHLRFVKADQPLDPASPLRELGLDSMGALDLIQDLEQQFGLRFPDELLVEETFRSADSITAALRTLAGD